MDFRYPIFVFIFKIFAGFEKVYTKKDKQFGKNWLELASLKIDNKEN